MGGKPVKCLTSPSPINSAKSESGSTPSEDKAGFDLGHDEEDGEEKVGARTEIWSHAFPELDHRYVVSHVEENGGRLPVEWSPKCPAPSLETSWEEHLLEQQDHLEKEMEEAKRMISGLQALLLNGSLPEDEQERSLVLCEQEACPEEQLVIIRSRLDQSLEENQDLKKELQKCKQESRNLQGVKDALQQRLAQQDALMLQIKQELLRANMDKEELRSQNADLQRKVEERNRLLAEYKVRGLQGWGVGGVLGTAGSQEALSSHLAEVRTRGEVPTKRAQGQKSQLLGSFLFHRLWTFSAIQVTIVPKCFFFRRQTGLSGGFSLKTF
ncbi:dixin-like, partial [Pantherophis guttatus]|uniref:Dixin-like n=1 Tax=Pantherophis guttatus TaxID=94885 RepID=A0ABM3ZQ40_PANGU